MLGPARHHASFLALVLPVPGNPGAPAPCVEFGNWSGLKAPGVCQQCGEIVQVGIVEKLYMLNWT
jgi:hypothetical protein